MANFTENVIKLKGNTQNSRGKTQGFGKTKNAVCRKSVGKKSGLSINSFVTCTNFYLKQSILCRFLQYKK